jgi:hypothetical protein
VTYVEVFDFDLGVLRQVVVLLRNQYSLYKWPISECALAESNIPVKRYWWIFFRSAFGINLPESATRQGLVRHAIEEPTFRLRDKEQRHGVLAKALQVGEFEAAGVLMSEIFGGWCW